VLLTKRSHVQLTHNGEKAIRQIKESAIYRFTQSSSLVPQYNNG
jgi:hypothetical protein